MQQCWRLGSRTATTPEELKLDFDERTEGRQADRRAVVKALLDREDGVGSVSHLPQKMALRETARPSWVRGAPENLTLTNSS